MGWLPKDNIISSAWSSMLVGHPYRSKSRGGKLMAWRFGRSCMVPPNLFLVFLLSAPSCFRTSCGELGRLALEAAVLLSCCSIFWSDVGSFGYIARLGRVVLRSRRGRQASFLGWARSFRAFLFIVKWQCWLSREPSLRLRMLRRKGCLRRTSQCCPMWP